MSAKIQYTEGDWQRRAGDLMRSEARLGEEVAQLRGELAEARAALEEIDDWTRWQAGSTVGEVIPERVGAAQVIEEWRAPSEEPRAQGEQP